MGSTNALNIVVFDTQVRFSQRIFSFLKGSIIKFQTQKEKSDIQIRDNLPQ